MLPAFEAAQTTRPCITLHYKKTSQKRCFTSRSPKPATFIIINNHAEIPYFEGDWLASAKDFESLRSLHFTHCVTLRQTVTILAICRGFCAVLPFARCDRLRHVLTLRA
jgi:hypothetical protein